MLHRPLLLLSLLTLTLSGCFEDVLSEEEVPTVAEPGRFTFTIDETEERAVRNAYVLTQSVQNGTLFMHHLILTANDVWEDGRLTDTSDAIIVAYVTERPDISADFRTVTGDTEELYGGRIVHMGAQQGLLFDGQLNVLGHPDFLFASLSVRETEAGVYSISLIFDHERDRLDMSGQFTGEVRNLNSYNAAPIPADVFGAESQVTYSLITTPLNYAYFELTEESLGDNFYRLYLSENPLTRNDTLLGTSDLVALRISSPELLADGLFPIRQTEAYVDKNIQRHLHRAYYCENMNFTTGRAEFERTGTDGQAYISYDGEILKVNFSFETDGGLNHIAGNYIGEVVSAVRPR